jgi:hypothetical protein
MTLSLEALRKIDFEGILINIRQAIAGIDRSIREQGKLSEVLKICDIEKKQEN